jgi:hypothetical protein
MAGVVRFFMYSLCARRKHSSNRQSIVFSSRRVAARRIFAPESSTPDPERRRRSPRPPLRERDRPRAPRAFIQTPDRLPRS